MTELLGLVECPHCAVRLRGPKPVEPRNVRCVRCESVFMLRPEDMVLDTILGLDPNTNYPTGRCPSCQGKIRFPAGDAISGCMHCGQRILVSYAPHGPQSGVPPVISIWHDPAPSEQARPDGSPAASIFKVTRGGDPVDDTGEATGAVATEAVPASSEASIENDSIAESGNVKPHASWIKLWLARIGLVFLTFLCFPLILVGQELLAVVLPVTKDWGLIVALLLGLTALGGVMHLWEAATKRYSPKKERQFETYHGLIYPFGIMLKVPNDDTAGVFSRMEHCFGVENGNLVLGFRPTFAPNLPLGTMSIEQTVPLSDLRRVSVRVIDDDELQNSAFGDAVADSFARAVSHHRLHTKTVGAEISLFVEGGRGGKMDQYVLGVPVDFPPERIELLAVLADTKSPSVSENGEAGQADNVSGVVGAAEKYKTIANILQIDNVTTSLASGIAGIGSVAGFIGRISSVYQLNNKNAGLTAALIASAIQEFAPHVEITRE